MGSRSADAHRNPGTTHGISTSTSNVSIGNGTVTVKVRARLSNPIFRLYAQDKCPITNQHNDRALVLGVLFEPTFSVL